MHRVQVVDERLHRLIGAAFGLAVAALRRVVDDALGSRFVAHRRQAFAQGVVKFLIRLEGRLRANLFFNLADDALGFLVGRVVIQQQLKCRAKRTAVFLDIGLGDAGRHVIVKAGNRLTTVLIVLVALNGDAGKCGIAADILRLAQHAVTRGEAALEQLGQVNLRAGRRQRQKVEIMNMNIALAMGARMLRIQNIHIIELLRAFRAVLEHRAHRGIAVDICVLALHVGFGRILERDILQNVHQAGLGLAGAAALRAIENIRLRGFGIPFGDERLLDLILYILNRGNLRTLSGVDFTSHDSRQTFGFLISLAALHGVKRALNRRCNLPLIVDDPASVTFCNILRHCHSLPCFRLYDFSVPLPRGRKIKKPIRLPTLCRLVRRRPFSVFVKGLHHILCQSLDSIQHLAVCVNAVH